MDAKLGDSSIDVSHASITENTEPAGGIKALWREKHVMSLALFSNLGGFLYGCVFSGILVMSNFERNFPPITTDSVTMKGLVSSNSWSSEKFGRKQSISLACAFAILGAALQTGARNPAFFYVGRFFTGVGVGALSVGVPLYNTEISPSRIRGGLGSLFQLSVELGTFVAFWIDFGCNYIGGTAEGQTEAAWRIPMAIQLIPALILAVGILFVPESPRWLISRNRDEAARRALVSLRQRPEDSKEVQMEYLQILGEHKFQQELGALEKGSESDGFISSAWNQWTYLFRSAANRKRVLVGVALMFFQCWNGMNGILFYAPTIFQGLGLSGTTVSLLATGVVGAVMLIATLPTVLFLDQKPVLIFGALAMGVCHALIAGLSGKYEDSWESHKAAGWVACVFVWIFSALFAMSLGPVTWVITAGVKEWRIAGSSSWLNAFAVSMATPPMLESLKFGTYIFFGAWCFVAAAFCVFIPETAGRSLEDMDAAFGDTSRTSEQDQERMNRINHEIGYDKYQDTKF
ncbi:general substrate transporter [Coprinellus micaceus]|uniref:General substrate transporter n=1 Tax=Coprinellus micaceus TaxID=71717 RepID=A0A4Y7SL42_COPMI|nr:general substrate transporter [Coprinellus micaceus]